MIVAKKDLKKIPQIDFHHNMQVVSAEYSQIL